jgi:hypothetical protein
MFSTPLDADLGAARLGRGASTGAPAALFTPVPPELFRQSEKDDVTSLSTMT